MSANVNITYRVSWLQSSISTWYFCCTAQGDPVTIPSTRVTSHSQCRGETRNHRGFNKYWQVMFLFCNQSASELFSLFAYFVLGLYFSMLVIEGVWFETLTLARPSNSRSWCQWWVLMLLWCCPSSPLSCANSGVMMIELRHQQTACLQSAHRQWEMLQYSCLFCSNSKLVTKRKISNHLNILTYLP